MSLYLENVPPQYKHMYVNSHRITISPTSQIPFLSANKYSPQIPREGKLQRTLDRRETSHSRYREKSPSILFRLFCPRLPLNEFTSGQLNFHVGRRSI